MPLAPGTRLGPYEVTAQIGVGGMGEVYRGRDATLSRDVAIKVLPAALASDTERLARFKREAQVLASLNHPNIAHVYGFEGATLPDGSTAHFLAMEMVEGEDLSEHLKRGAIPFDDAIALAKQMAEGLEDAHEHGIIHRDLKPANIKLTPGGKVKILDFGLAKALEGDPTSSQANSQLSHSPTMSRHMTEAGMIMGTAAYMSPEQARGKTVDKRADIWSFGVVLFEMLTGTRLFAGETVSDTLASVLKEEVPWNRLPKDTPPHVTQVLKRCLTRDAHDRLRDIGDARMALMGAFETLAPQAAGASRAPLAWKAAFAVAALMAVALAVPAVKHLRETPPPATRIARVTLGIAPADRLGPAEEMGRPSRTAFAVSPDGGAVVLSGETTAPGSRPTTRLYRRPLAEAEAVAIPGTEGASYPFFSPDGQWVGFAADNTLKKVALSGGPPIALCDSAGRIGGASWGSAGVIAFARGGLWTVSESGGKPEAAVEAARGTYAPTMLPDGQTVLFTEVPGDGQWENAHVDAINLTTKQRTTLLTNAADARYSPTGHLVFMRNAALLAVPFDATRVAVTGAAVPLLASVMQSTNATLSDRETGMGQFALSASGMLLYAAGDRYPTLTSTLVRVDRKGAETALAEIKAFLGGLRLSPSGARVVAYKTGDGSRAIDVWTYDLPSGTPTRLTSTGDAEWPLFSPDGTSVMFRRSGSAAGSYALPLNGSTAPQRLIEEKAGFLGASWSPDGKWLASLQGLGGVRQIFVRPMRDGRPDAGEPRKFSPSTFNQRDAQFSPDGRWIAYSSDESGASEVYVQPFPGPGEKRRLSSNGGANPAWSRNGRELFFLVRPVPERPDVAMMSVEVSTDGDFKASAPRVLFEGPYGTTSPLRSYDVTADGHFIMSRRQPPPDQPVTTLQVVLGWAEELKAKVQHGK